MVSICPSVIFAVVSRNISPEKFEQNSPFCAVIVEIVHFQETVRKSVVSFRMGIFAAQVSFVNRSAVDILKVNNPLTAQYTTCHCGHLVVPRREFVNH